MGKTAAQQVNMSSEVKKLLQALGHPVPGCLGVENLPMPLQCQPLCIAVHFKTVTAGWAVPGQQVETRSEQRGRQGAGFARLRAVE